MVRELVLKRLTGSENLTWFTKQILDRQTPFGRVLTFGDGFGMAGEAFQTKHDTLEIINLNVSSGEEMRFKKVMDAVHADFPYQCVLADGNHFDYSKLGLFDTIIEVGAFHHFEKFENAFPKINKILKPNGKMYVDEYVGPSKYQFTKKVVEIINDELKSLPDVLVLNRKSVSCSDFSDLWCFGPDPSEGVRAGELEDSLKKYFQLESCDNVGGTILQPFFLLSLMQPVRLNIPNWHHAPEGIEATTRLVKLEEDLIKKGEIRSDYCYYIFTHKE